MEIRELIFIFIVSFITNATPFFGAPYTIITSTIIIRHGASIEAIIEGIIISALGATLAKTIMFIIGVGLRKPLRQNKNVKFFMKYVSKRPFFIGLFITAILPFFPFDDYFFLIGGTSKASLIRMLSITFSAKIIKSGFEIPLEVYGIISIGRHLRFEPLLLGIISSVIFTILGILLFIIDIEKILNKIITTFKFIKLKFLSFKFSRI
ncbi:MAG: hypothetical protein RQ952_04010 [Thermoproteota archaeon]|nr:hypothetical protein [Thermoproteota archaeon]